MILNSCTSVHYASGSSSLIFFFFFFFSALLGVSVATCMGVVKIVSTL